MLKCQRLDTSRTQTQYTERIFNRIAKAINETFTGRKCMPQGFRIYFELNPKAEGMEFTT